MDAQRRLEKDINNKGGLKRLKVQNKLHRVYYNMTDSPSRTTTYPSKNNIYMEHSK